MLARLRLMMVDFNATVPVSVYILNFWSHFILLSSFFLKILFYYLFIYRVDSPTIHTQKKQYEVVDALSDTKFNYMIRYHRKCETDCFLGMERTTVLNKQSTYIVSSVVASIQVSRLYLLFSNISSRSMKDIK